ncbi:MAG: ATPase of 26S proteasome regulatory subunit 4 [Trizodia sp. TS-e1964]|nr:MAG: ATPase of 26S proteasome regulatory subunit 4 [Trizodia sp. TS-e1964]
MSLGEDVELEEFINQKDDLSGADIKAICSEAGLMALRERRMRVQMSDFRTARERVLKTKSEGEPEGICDNGQCVTSVRGSSGIVDCYDPDNPSGTTQSCIDNVPTKTCAPTDRCYTCSSDLPFCLWGTYIASGAPTLSWFDCVTTKGSSLTFLAATITGSPISNSLTGPTSSLPSPTTTSTTTEPPSSLSRGAIGGIAAGSAVFFFAAVLLAFFVVFKRGSKKKPEQQEVTELPMSSRFELGGAAAYIPQDPYSINPVDSRRAYSSYDPNTTAELPVGKYNDQNMF